MSDPESTALELLRVMPEDLAESLHRTRENQPLVTRMFTEWVGAKHRELDIRTLEAATRYLAAGRGAWQAVAEAKLARHRALRQETTLAQEDELQDVQHETRLLMEREQQEWLRMGTMQRRHVQAKLKARIARLQREFIRREEPAPKAVTSWEQLLSLLTGNITGGEDFRTRSEEFLAGYEAKRQAEIGRDDPRRQERLAAIDTLVEDLRGRRDQMMRDRWNWKG